MTMIDDEDIKSNRVRSFSLYIYIKLGIFVVVYY